MKFKKLTAMFLATTIGASCLPVMVVNAAEGVHKTVSIHNNINEINTFSNITGIAETVDEWGGKASGDVSAKVTGSGEHIVSFPVTNSSRVLAKALTFDVYPTSKQTHLSILGRGGGSNWHWNIMYVPASEMKLNEWNSVTVMIDSYALARVYINGKYVTYKNAGVTENADINVRLGALYSSDATEAEKVMYIDNVKVLSAQPDMPSVSSRTYTVNGDSIYDLNGATVSDLLNNTTYYGTAVQVLDADGNDITASGETAVTDNMQMVVKNGDVFTQKYILKTSVFVEKILSKSTNGTSEKNISLPAATTTAVGGIGGKASDDMAVQMTTANKEDVICFMDDSVYKMEHGITEISYDLYVEKGRGHIKHGRSYSGSMGLDVQFDDLNAGEWNNIKIIYDPTGAEGTVLLLNNKLYAQTTTKMSPDNVQKTFRLCVDSPSGVTSGDFKVYVDNIIAKNINVKDIPEIKEEVLLAEYSSDFRGVLYATETVSGSLGKAENDNFLKAVNTSVDGYIEIPKGSANWNKPTTLIFDVYPTETNLSLAARLGYHIVLATFTKKELNMNSWNRIMATYDPATKTSTYYLNGKYHSKYEADISTNSVIYRLITNGIATTYYDNIQVVQDIVTPQGIPEEQGIFADKGTIYGYSDTAYKITSLYENAKILKPDGTEVLADAQPQAGDSLYIYRDNVLTDHYFFAEGDFVAKVDVIDSESAKAARGNITVSDGEARDIAVFFAKYDTTGKLSGLKYERKQLNGSEGVVTITTEAMAVSEDETAKAMMWDMTYMEPVTDYKEYRPVITEEEKTQASVLIKDIETVSPSISEDGTRLILPQIDGYDVSLYGSSEQAVIDLDGQIHKPLENMTVTVMYKAVNENDPSDVGIASREAAITVPGMYNKSATDNPKPQVLPGIREWKGNQGFFTLTDSSRIVVADESLKETADMIAFYFEEMLGRKIEVSMGTASVGDIYISLGNKSELGEEGYTVDISDKITVEAYNAKGALYAGTTLTQILHSDENHTNIPKGLIRDYPAYEERACMFDVARIYIPIDYLEEVTKYMAYYKYNQVHIHINEEYGEQSTCFRVESKKYPQINSGNAESKVYTQDEYRNYQKEVAKFGIKVITEIDTPSHAGFVRLHNPSFMIDPKGYYIDVKDEAAVAFVKSVFDEFLDGEDPVIQSDTIHVGCDEYLRHDERFDEYKEAVADYAREISEYVMNKGYECRMWNGMAHINDASGEGMFPGIGVVSTDVALNYFSYHQANYGDTINGNYKCINSRSDLLYIVPGKPGFANDLTLEYLYDNWDVQKLDGGYIIPKASPQMIGAEPCFWSDIKVGYSEFDVFHAMKKEIMLAAEKTWYGEKTVGQTAEKFLERVDMHGKYAPGANPSRYDRSEELYVAGYDFEAVTGNNVKDKGTNGYDGEMVNITVEADGTNHYAVLNGDGYITLPIKALGYPYTANFDICINSQTPQNAVLFSGKEGTLYLNFNGTGKMAYTRKGYTYLLDYVLPTDVWQTITLVCNNEDFSLYVDGIYCATGAFYNVSASKQISSTYVLPLEKIGEGVIGYIDNVELYSDSECVVENMNGNLALNKPVTVSSLEVEGMLLGECAVDGNVSTRWSSSQAEKEQWIVVDLEKMHKINKVTLNFQECPKYQILVSKDGINYDMVAEATANQINTVEKTFTFDAVEARYVKFLQLEQRNYNGALFGVAIWEFEVYYDRALEAVA